MPIEFDLGTDNFAKIKVIGVGGGGGNAVNRMLEYGLQGADFIIVNTDKQALCRSPIPYKIQIGEKVTKGLGSGGEPEVGRKSAEESYEELEQAIKGSDLVFIAAGLGGGTGTGAAPIVSQIAKDMGVLTIGFVTMPFWFEGQPRMRLAEQGFAQMKESVDSIIRIPNDKLLETVGKSTPLKDSFKLADDALRQGVQGLTDLIAKPAIINLDFADVRTVMKDSGTAHMGIGVGYGDTKVIDAAQQAIMSPLLETSIQGAKGIVFNITGDPTFSLTEMQDAVALTRDAADPQANIFVGADVDETLEDEVRITVIATGFGGEASPVKKEKIAKKTIEENIANFGSMNIEEDNDFEVFEEEEPEVPIFIRKTPKRARKD